MSNKIKVLWIVIVIIAAAAIAAGSYFFIHTQSLKEKSQQDIKDFQGLPSGPEDIITVSIHYPGEDKLEQENRKISRRTGQTGLAKAVLEEYFRGPEHIKTSRLPQNVKVLGLYRDAAQILYIDLSDEFRRNFQGDALSEYLLLKGIFETLIVNVQDFQDIKILVEGKELETLGGHFYLKYKLKNIVSTEFRGEKKATDER